jgi:hypothetical protein
VLVYYLLFAGFWFFWPFTRSIISAHAEKELKGSKKNSKTSFCLGILYQSCNNALQVEKEMTQ